MTRWQQFTAKNTFLNSVHGPIKQITSIKQNISTNRDLYWYSGSNQFVARKLQYNTTQPIINMTV